MRCIFAPTKTSREAPPSPHLSHEGYCSMSPVGVHAPSWDPPFDWLPCAVGAITSRRKQLLTATLGRAPRRLGRESYSTPALLGAQSRQDRGAPDPLGPPQGLEIRSLSPRVSREHPSAPGGNSWLRLRIPEKLRILAVQPYKTAQFTQTKPNGG